jgi:F420-dependent oxidoreductase-like protein
MVKFGLQIPWFSWDGAPANHRTVLRDIARTAEDEGFSSLWVMDHHFQIPMVGDATLDMHECYTTLGYLAGVTEKITLGPLVSGVTYRHPGIHVKQVTSLDVLSGGRAWFAIGAAWFEREHDALGVGFPSTRERFERLEEAVKIAQQMWSDDDGAFRGKHYSLEETICSPKPIQSPHPPIMIGGSGEKKTLRLVAQHADACNISGFMDIIPRKFDVLKKHCEDVGRDFDDIERTRLGTVFPGTDVAGEAKELIDAGVQHLIYNMPAVQTLEGIKMLGREVMPALAQS